MDKDHNSKMEINMDKDHNSKMDLKLNTKLKTENIEKNI